MKAVRTLKAMAGLLAFVAGLSQALPAEASRPQLGPTTLVHEQLLEPALDKYDSNESSNAFPLFTYDDEQLLLLTADDARVCLRREGQRGADLRAAAEQAFPRVVHVDFEPLAILRYGYDVTGKETLLDSGDIRVTLGANSLPIQGFRLFARAVRSTYSHRARWYDPRTASWLSEDPEGDVDSPNLYAFVGQRPHEKTDPLGLAGDSEGTLEVLSRMESAAGKQALWQSKKDVLIASEALSDLYLRKKIGGLSRNLLPPKDVYANGIDAAYITGEGAERKLLLVDTKHSFWRTRNAGSVTAFENVNERALLDELLSAGRITREEQSVLIRNLGNTERMVVGTGAIKGVSEKLEKQGIKFLRLEGEEAAQLARIQGLRASRIKSYFTRTLGKAVTAVAIASITRRTLAGDFQGASEEALLFHPGIAAAVMAKELGTLAAETSFESLRDRGKGLTRIQDEKHRLVVEGE
ncbi:MAG: RHS repeat-associated core domain-containing protein [Thermoanaerobaculia bacterium]